MNLIANNLSYKPHDQYHLNEVSFSFKEGNLYTILGRTLSGKTTLLKTIAGLVTPDSGDIEFDGKNFLKIPVWDRNVAMVYQQFINYPHLNVFENVAFPLKQRKIEQTIVIEKVMDALKSVGLIGYENRKIQEHLEHLFYDVLNVEFNLVMWVRNLCKYGDFFLYLDKQ